MSIEIIAEIAQGFEGKPEQSKLLIKAAASALADAAKFQLVYADELAIPGYKYYELFKSLEMSDEIWINLANYARESGIELYLDIFGERSLSLAETMKTKTIKLHGTDITNEGLLAKVNKSTIKNILLGAGGAHLSEIKKALSILSNKQVIVLLGYQGYPTPDDMNQIARVRSLSASIAGDRVLIGFADHAEPFSKQKYTIAATALGAGATVIEKHLTLGKSMKLEDFESALNPDEFLTFVNTIRACASAIGSVGSGDDFGMSESEKAYRKMIRRHLIARVNLKQGEKIEPEHVVLKRSSIENYLYDFQSVYGKILNKDIAANMPITLEDLI